MLEEQQSPEAGPSTAHHQNQPHSPQYSEGGTDSESNPEQISNSPQPGLSSEFPQNQPQNFQHASVALNQAGAGGNNDSDLASGYGRKRRHRLGRRKFVELDKVRFRYVEQTFTC